MAAARRPLRLSPLPRLRKPQANEPPNHPSNRVGKQKLAASFTSHFLITCETPNENSRNGIIAGQTLSHLHSLMVTMSQKSSVPQAIKSVSQALMPDSHHVASLSQPREADLLFGSPSHLEAVLRKGRKSAKICAGSGFVWGIPANTFDQNFDRPPPVTRSKLRGRTKMVHRFCTVSTTG